MRKQMLGVPVDIVDGTIKLPEDMLQFAGIEKTVEVFADSTCIYLRTADKWCDFCGTNGNISKVGDKHICPSCLGEISKAVEGGVR